MQLIIQQKFISKLSTDHISLRDDKDFLGYIISSFIRSVTIMSIVLEEKHGTDFLKPISGRYEQIMHKQRSWGLAYRKQL